MPEWWTYTLGDFLMFAPRTYYRMIERYNAAVWPAHLLTTGLGVAIAGLGLRPSRGRIRLAGAVLAVLWAWVGTAFLWQRYAVINWPARWFAVLFALEASLLALVGGALGTLAIGHRARRVPAAGLVLLGLGIVAYPLLAPITGRGWAQAEAFGLMPEPTAVATLGWLFLQDGIGTRELKVIPALWCLFAGLTLLALGASEAAVPLLAVMVAIVLAVRGALARARSAG